MGNGPYMMAFKKAEKQSYLFLDRISLCSRQTSVSPAAASHMLEPWDNSIEDPHF